MKIERKRTIYTIWKIDKEWNCGHKHPNLRETRACFKRNKLQFLAVGDRSAMAVVADDGPHLEKRHMSEEEYAQFCNYR